MTRPLTGARVQITPQGFALFRDFLQEACGILLGDNKEYLVSSRLSSIMNEQSYSSLDELVSAMRRSSRLKEQVVDAMTTNETLWFRDIHPFNILRDRLLPELSSGMQPLRIWSAACSSGQEPYSISMTLDEFKRSRPGQLKAGERIVATDISPTMLEHARRGTYDMLAVGRGLQKDHLSRHFRQNAEGGWQINRDIQSRVEFKSLNLLGNYGILGKFDIVFCRNVLIYFSSDLKQQILRKIHTQLKPGGYLFLGASESLGHLSDIYEMVHCSPGIIYRAK
ncbi:protein-glutamate O-methyltransferase CheR [Motiliproteus coralliicola]|uniref:Chemotaxis protein methyltransferase n=1 Tax=Motiliproteus coralliicola TaxID=2283196 RepID=A0A369WSC4_9GAMM|nr:protein-glutamate O-methyltransferase CheR [Motiliproteus coralliicola]RDE22385.1 protein-glutamate O-methyltransferase CheR [Motiliproteus coralliicola]